MCFDEYLLTFKEGGETPTTLLGCFVPRFSATGTSSYDGYDI